MKKKSIKFAMAITAITLLIIAGCKKEEFPSKVDIASHPTITLVGDPIIVLNVGEPYNDPGATYYDSVYGDNGTLTTSTVINTDEEGFFIVRYTAENAYGLASAETRLIVVSGASDALDISGEYYHDARGGTAIVTKLGKGLFLTDNVSGGAAGSSEAYFMFTSDSTIIMPCQFLAGNGVDACFTSVSYDFSTLSYTYKIVASGFGPGARLFEKQ